MLQSSTIQFLKNLKKNNNKPWFDGHRTQYEAAKKDVETFIQSVIDQHSKKDPDLTGLTGKGCLFRIHRDVRFSKDKTPYKTNMGASMSKGGKKSVYAGYYFHCEPGNSFVGGGIWMPEAPQTKKIRQEIDYCLEEFSDIVKGKKFKSIYGGLEINDDWTLSKVPQGFEKDNPAAEYLKLKSWIATAALKDEVLTSKDLLKKTLTAFETLQPLVAFLNRAMED